MFACSCKSLSHRVYGPCCLSHSLCEWCFRYVLVSVGYPKGGGNKHLVTGYYSGKKF